MFNRQPIPIKIQQIKNQIAQLNNYQQQLFNEHMRLQDRYGMGKDFNLGKALNRIDKDHIKRTIYDGPIHGCNGSIFITASKG